MIQFVQKQPVGTAAMSAAGFTYHDRHCAAPSRWHFAYVFDGVNARSINDSAFLSATLLREVMISVITLLCPLVPSMADNGRNTTLHRLLQQYWQVSKFRALQQEAVTATIDRQDAVLILSTGTRAS